MGEEALFRKVMAMSTIFITNDNFNHGSKWEVVIGTERFHCHNDDEVLELIKMALSEKTIAGAPEISAAKNERIFEQGDWGD